jgi:hypothetical protein
LDHLDLDEHQDADDDERTDEVDEVKLGIETDYDDPEKKEEHHLQRLDLGQDETTLKTSSFHVEHV